MNKLKYILSSLLFSVSLNAVTYKASDYTFAQHEEAYRVGNSAVMAEFVDRVSWNSNDAAFEVITGYDGVIQTIGQEFTEVVRNNTGSTIPNGTIVKVTGSIGGRNTVSPAIADSLDNISDVIGVTTMTIPNNSYGIITKLGKLHDLNTSMYTLGDRLYLSSSVAGAWTSTAPAIPLLIGRVTYVHSSSGEIELSLQDKNALTLGGQPITYFTNASNITTGTLADARIASTIARDSEITSAINALSTVYQPLDADLTAWAAINPTTWAGSSALSIAASQVSDFDTEVSNNTDVAANTSARHVAVTVTDSSEIDLALTGQDLTASLISGSIDETKLDTSVNASLDLADSALQSSTIGVTVQAYDADLDDLADGSLSGSKVGTGINGDNVTTGTIADARIASTIARDSEIESSIDAVIDRRSYTLSWAGTTTSLHLNNADLMQSGRVIKSMVIRNAAAGSFKIGNRSVLDYYAASVTTTTTKPTTVALTNITWNWTDGRIVFTPLSSYYGTITVDIEFVDNPAPSYVTSEETLTLYAASLGYKITDTGVQSTITSFFEAISGGRNTVKFTAEGVPGIYVKITPTQDPLSAPILTELGYSDSSEHPVWTVGGVLKSAFYVAKYEGVLINVSTGAIVANTSTKVNTAYRIASLKMVDPVADINFDESITICRQNGTGYHHITNAEWSYLYLRSLSLSHEPRGNNNNGADYSVSSEKGTLVAGSYDATDIRTLTGAPYNAWSHDNTAYGVMGLNGNVFEWVAGSRTNNGEIQIIPDNNAALSTTDFGVSSTDWEAILEDGSEVTPGTALTLKWDHSAADGSGNLILKDAITYYSSESTFAQTQFNAITASGVTAPSIIKALGFFPMTAAVPTRGRFYDRNNGERLPLRGGTWISGSAAGVAALYNGYTRSARYGIVGVRSAFVE